MSSDDHWMAPPRRTPKTKPMTPHAMTTPDPREALRQIDAALADVGYKRTERADIIRAALAQAAPPSGLDVDAARDAARRVGRLYKPSGLYDELMEEVAAVILAALSPTPDPVELPDPVEGERHTDEEVAELVRQRRLPW